jgi:hypothetical protein
MKYISHPFFPLGATLYRLSDNTSVFIYPSEDSLNGFMAWYTGDSITDVDKFLNECEEGQHSALGSGFCDTWGEIMKQLTDFQ